MLVVLRLLAEGLTRGLARLRHPRSPLLRLALGDLTRPGAATGGVITALGLGLTLLATVTLLDSSIAKEVNEALPARAPSFFFVDIQPDQIAAFDKTITSFRSAKRLSAHTHDPGPHHRPQRRAAVDAKVRVTPNGC